MTSFVLISGLFWVGCVYSMFTAGLSGGPNHGDHPLGVTILHLIGYFIYAQSFAEFYTFAYAGLIFLLFVLSIFSFSLLGRYGSVLAWITRVLFLIVYSLQYWLILGYR